MNLSTGLLTRLRAFEAVGRHRSFNRAAQELGVTPTALSHHVRKLEDELGVELFTRLHRRVELTAPGELALDDCTRAMRLLQQAAERAAGANADTILRISVAPFFSARWLIPRLGTFWAEHPTVQVQLHHAYQPADFLRDRADAGISWGSGTWPGAEVIPLVRGHLTAICSNEVRRRLPAVPTAQHLARWPLLYEFSPDHWLRWFEACGATLPPEATLVGVDDSHALLNLVLDGRGIGLFFADLVRDDLRLDQLSRPVDLEIDPGSAYYLTRPTGAVMTPQLRTFWEWLVDEAELDRPRPATSATRSSGSAGRR